MSFRLLSIRLIERIDDFESDARIYIGRMQVLVIFRLPLDANGNVAIVPELASVDR